MSTKPKSRHARQERAPERRGSARERGYTRSWEKRRIVFLHEHPLCAECEKHGSVRAAEVVDHIIPHRGDMELFWDETNWQGLCIPHHNQKTARGE